MGSDLDRAIPALTEDLGLQSPLRMTGTSLFIRFTRRPRGTEGPFLTNRVPMGQQNRKIPLVLIHIATYVKDASFKLYIL